MVTNSNKSLLEDFKNYTRTLNHALLLWSVQVKWTVEESSLKCNWNPPSQKSILNLLCYFLSNRLMGCRDLSYCQLRAEYYSPNKSRMNEWRKDAATVNHKHWVIRIHRFNNHGCFHIFSNWSKVKKREQQQRTKQKEVVTRALQFSHQDFTLKQGKYLSS